MDSKTFSVDLIVDFCTTLSHHKNYLLATTLEFIYKIYIEKIFGENLYFEGHIHKKIEQF